MKTISITIPEKFEQFEEEDMQNMFQQCFEEFLETYFEHREDIKLRDRIRKHPRIQGLTHQLADIV